MLHRTLRISTTGILILAASCARSGGAVVHEPGMDPLRDAPAAVDYRIAAGDALDVVVFDAPELSRPVRVTEQGEISLPLLGSLRAGGLTPQELEAAIATSLRGRYMRDPQVSVSVTEARRDPIYVTGEVNRPGAFPLEGGRSVTVLQAVALGQGLAPLAAKERAMVIRTGADGARQRIPINIGDMLSGSSPDLPLQPNDIVFVPRSTGRSVANGLFGAFLRMVTFRGIF